MKQVVQHYGTGEMTVDDVPAPGPARGCLQIATIASLISAGTERATVDLARKNLANKARSRPDLVRKVLSSAAKDGIQETIRIVRGRLDTLGALGYSAAGRVLAVGEGVTGWRVGDLVACAGQNLASHAEVLSVPVNLCTPIPPAVEPWQAAYVAVGAIALQGVRQTAPQLGETVAVIGLGLVGQLTVQLLAANGCRVLATDLDPARCVLAAEQDGVQATAQDFEAFCASETAGMGVDAAVITASTRSSEPLQAAAELVRKRGVVVVVGAVGLEVPREPFYVKEIDLRLSTSYGPGRYDDSYERAGQDYPYAYVRWTEQRNMKAFLELVASGQVRLERLTTDRFPIDDALEAYERLLDSNAASLGIIIDYPDEAEDSALLRRRVELTPASKGDATTIQLGVIGAGSHVRDRLFPVLSRSESFRVRAIAGRDGVTAKQAARAAKADYCTTDVEEMLADPSTNAVLIGTRHDSHAGLILRALEAGKHVFCEKPLCITEQELLELEAWLDGREHRPVLFLGFNRRYSAHADRLRAAFADRRDPLTLLYRVNAGSIPADHWTQQPSVGGGRLIGEGCHFVDFMAMVVGAEPTAVRAISLDRHSTGVVNDKVSMLVTFADGSVGTLVYCADGGQGLSKEYLEVHGAGRSAVLDDFVTTRVYGRGAGVFRTRPRDRGFVGELRAFAEAILDPESFEDPLGAQLAVTRATIFADRSLHEGGLLQLDR